MRTFGTWTQRSVVITAQRIVLALLTVITWASTAVATTVTPSDRVKNFVTVRAIPSGQSAAIDKLLVGAEAQELESVPHWLKVQLANGTVGFVNKAWVTEMEGTPVPTTGSTPISVGTPTPTPVAAGGAAPAPLLSTGHPVSWWFVFKFNSAAFPACGTGVARHCPFGGTVQTGTNYAAFSQQFVYASSEAPTLQKGSGCIGDTDTDPVGATFGQVYNGAFHYVLWNDQFYDDPPIAGCQKFCPGPWAHSKGMVAWNDAGEGVVMQVTTPSWPAAGSKDAPRQSDGNTLGCIQKDNDVKFSQHFFSVQLTHQDLIQVLTALQNASAVTDSSNAQIVNNGGPTDVQALVGTLGTQAHGSAFTTATLSSGVELISKPSALAVPPWQMVSAVLGGAPLRVASWWSTSKINSTTAATPVGCWDPSLGAPGAVEIATSGQWNGVTFGLKGGTCTDCNHAKIGVSTSGTHHYAIFGDMNQEGTLSGSDCTIHQNGRGGLFFVVENADLADSVKTLMAGSTAP